MKTLGLATTVLAFLLVPVGDALPPGPSRLFLQATLLHTEKAGPISLIRTYALYNKPSYRNRIGTGVSNCTSATEKWVTCRIYARLGRGLIIADTLAPTAASFLTFAVTGGTGIYSNIGGTITVQPVGATHYLIIGTLEGLG